MAETLYCNRVKRQVALINGYPYSHVTRDANGSDQPCYCDKLKGKL